MIILTLTDDTLSADLQIPEVPITEETVNNDVEVTTLDNNVSVYIYPDSDKRVWSHTWAYMTETQYDIVKGFRDRQRTLFKYPTLTITEQGITNVPVYMKMSAKNTIDDCGEVANVSITLRESAQIGV